MSPSSLSALGVIQISGEDSISYLQGQLTCDMTLLHQNQWLAGAHCNAKGKLWSNFVILQATDALYMVMHKAVLAHSLAALRKYAVFSKVEINDVSGRYQVVASTPEQSIAEAIATANLPIHCQISVHPNASAIGDESRSRWMLHFIQYGYPWLANDTQVEQFIPQMLSLDTLDAISFTKGCYIGQETVARMHYRGKQNRVLYRLQGHSDHPITTGDKLECSLGESWRPTGSVINAEQDDTANWHLLAVLPADIDSESVFRLLGTENSQLTIVETKAS